VICLRCAVRLLNGSLRLTQNLFVYKQTIAAVSCGKQAQIYCFQCGDFVCHPIFDQEKERIDLTQQLPWQAWKEHAVQRSFDALQFFRVQDQGVFWRGMVATYPPLVPKEHVLAARACLLRQQIIRGELDGLLQRPEILRFGTRQQRTGTYKLEFWYFCTG